jgi:hypothetical protein
MKMVVQKLITIVTTGLLIATAIEPSVAQTEHRKHKRVARQVIVPPPVYGQSFGPASEYVPLWVRAHPDQCWIDEGYGRWSSCSGGGGGTR